MLPPYCVLLGSAPAPAVPFTPASLSGLQLWLRADAGLYQDSGLTTPATADGDPVGGWADQSGVGNHVTQATAGQRPTLKLAQINGLSALLYDVVDDNLTNAALGTLFSGADTPLTVLGVIKPTDVAGTYCWAGLGTTASPTPAMVLRTNGAAHDVFRRDDLSANVTASGGTATAAAAVVSAVFTGTTLGTWVNGAAAVAAGTAMDVGAITFNNFAVGAWVRSTITNPFKGLVGEIVVCAGALSPASRLSAEAYLKARWGTP